MKLPRRFRAEGRENLGFPDHNHGVDLHQGSLHRSHLDVSTFEGEEEEASRTPYLGTRTLARFRLSSSFKESHDFDETSKEEEAEEEEDLQLSERRRAMFEPLDPHHGWRRDRSPSSLLPPPDFEEASYPRGWLVGKKRKLVNVDVVESMRRVAVHEMNRKDREINGLNEQLEEDSRTMEHLQMQLQQERRKRLQIERDNTILQDQVNMLMNMLNEMEESVDNGDHMDPSN